MILEIEKYWMKNPLWNRHRSAILWLATGLLAFVALSWITANFVLLLWELPPWGAMDFLDRYHEVLLWFSGGDIYAYPQAVYPPATYAVLWLFHGWMPVFPAKLVWAVMTAAALVGLVYYLVRDCGAESTLEYLFVIAMVLSMDAVGFAIGHGQFPILTISAALAGIFFICRGQGRWRDDLAGAGFMVLALIKPTVAAPFFWMILFIPGRLRPAILVVTGYLILTLAAIPFQGGLLEVLQAWVTKALIGVEYGARMGAYGNLHTTLGSFGLEEWNTAFSLSILLGLGIWTYRYRQIDIWILLGITALVARFWVYHRAYDDVLLLLPMIALFRAAKGVSSEHTFAGLAGSLLALLIVVSLLSSFKLILPSSEELLKSIRALVYMAVLIFLFYWGWYEHNMKINRYVENSRAV